MMTIVYIILGLLAIGVVFALLKIRWNLLLSW